MGPPNAPDRTLLGEEAITQALAGLAWQRRGAEIIKTAKLGSFERAMAYVNDVAGLAEAVDHHPDIDIRWDTVHLTLTSHSSGGLTRADFELAADIDKLG
ncbi:MAG: 4a-hydroxytetrahydrobiopterin dehydratase [Acidimicrobiales bacterium]